MHRKFDPIHTKKEKNSQTNTNKNLQDILSNVVAFFSSLESFALKNILHLFRFFVTDFLRFVCCLHRFHRHIMQRKTENT